MKKYEIADLFKSSWLSPEGEQWLKSQEIAQLISYRDNLYEAKKSSKWDTYGYWAIQILRLLRRKKNAVAKITVEQAVDCIDDLNFFRTPWYFFPEGNNRFPSPDEYMHDRTFEQLTYADSAYTKYLVTAHMMNQAHPPCDPISHHYEDELIGILYTSPDEWCSTKISTRTAIAANLPYFQKVVIFHTYANVREYIMHRCPDLFLNASAENESGSKIVPIHTGPMWRRIHQDLAATPQFQGMDKAAMAPIYPALDLLNRMVSDAKNRKENTNA